MTGFLHDWLIPIIWACFWAYWFLAQRQSRDSNQAETDVSRLVHVSLLVAAFGLTFFAPISFLALRVLPAQPVVFSAGMIVMVMGLSLAVWARVHLGKYWSGAITIKANRQLIRTGPYAIVRHPIYTGGCWEWLARR